VTCRRSSSKGREFKHVIATAAPRIRGGWRIEPTELHAVTWRHIFPLPIWGEHSHLNRQNRERRGYIPLAFADGAMHVN